MLSETKALNSLEELCLMQVATDNSFTKVLNAPGGGACILFLVFNFKTWTRLFAFHIAQIPLGKLSIQLFFLQLWVNSMVGWAC